MNIKARNIQNRNYTNSTNSNNSNNSTDVKSVKKSKNEWIKFGLFVIGSLLAVALSFYLGAARERANSTSFYQTLIPETKKSGKKMKLGVHWRGSPITLNKDGDPEGDVCSILSDCFTSSYFQPDPIKYPENPMKTCHNTLKNILRSFDSGFYFDGPRVIGFVSSDLKRSQGFSSINIYNVCIRKEDRGKGVAKSLMSDYIKAITDRHIPTGTKVYVGLDVDFDTEMSVAAFAVYAKMGFNRWWEPCPSINDFDYQIIERQLLMANPEINSAQNQRPAFLFPMSQMILRRADTLHKQIRDTRGNVFTHFCMVMLLGADDFEKVGADIRDSVQDALKSSK